MTLDGPQAHGSAPRGPARRLAAGAGLAIGAGLAVPGAAGAADFTVTTLADDGAGSLRQAVADANENEGPDTVLFQSGLSGSIELTRDIDITDPVTIDGPGADVLSVRGGGEDSDRLFTITPQPGDDVRISDLTLADGGGANAASVSEECEYVYDYDTGEYVYDCTPVAQGEGYGGGVYNVSADLELAGVTLTGNTAREWAGAVFSRSAPLTVTDSLVDDNAADQVGGIRALGPLTVADSVISDNRSDEGGGGISARSGVVMTDSSVTGNVADAGNGGGIDAGPAGATTIRSSLIAGNSAGRDGGGLRLGIDDNSPAPVLENTTISGNSAGDDGGGVFSYAAAYRADELTARLTVHSSTISGNAALGNGGGIAARGVETYDPDTDATVLSPRLSNSIVGDNTGAGVSADVARIGDETEPLEAEFTLFEDDPGVRVDETVADSNIVGHDPQLGGLADNGGPTPTRAPEPTSPVVDTGSTTLTLDARGLARPVDLASLANSGAVGADGADMGAVELASVPTTDQESPAQEQQPTQAPPPPPPPPALTRETPEMPPLRVTGTGICAEDVATVVNGPGPILRGTRRADVIIGTPGPDVIRGGGGDDIICGGGGDDSIDGGSGDDELQGQRGDDTLRGGRGRDHLYGGPGSDRLFGGRGRDRLFGRLGVDRLFGGPGKDRLNRRRLR